MKRSFEALFREASDLKRMFSVFPSIRQAFASLTLLLPRRNTGRICVFTDTGRLHTIKVLDLPFGRFRDKGVPIDNFSN